MINDERTGSVAVARRRRIEQARRAALAACMALATTASAQTMLIGQTADFTGPQSGPVKETTAAAKAWFAEVNGKGGINGARVVLESLDDGFKVERTLDNAKQLIGNTAVLALFMTRGTANSEALLPVLAQARIALLAPGASSARMHEAANGTVFNIRPMFRTEAQRAVGQLAAQGIRRIAVVATDDASGKDVMVGAQAGFKGANIEPIAVAIIPRGDADLSTPLQPVAAAKPDAVLCMAIARSCVAVLKTLRQGGSKATLLSLSNTSSDAYIKELGKNAHGVIVVQAFPPPFSPVVAVSKSFLDFAERNQLPRSYASM
jgi:branched-chain amino acid transport system substrate-binding protein